MRFEPTVLTGIVCVFLCMPQAMADDKLRQGSDFITISLADGEPRSDVHDLMPPLLCIADGELYFACFRKPTTADVAKVSDIPKFSDSRIEQMFRREGQTLRIDILEEDRDKLKKSAAKNGWFLTADYSTTPPRVILTKEESKYSHWSFTPLNDNHARVAGNDIDCFVRNDNDLGKPAWLSIEKAGVLKLGPQIVSNQTVADICRRPTLSFEHKTKFNIGDPNDGK